MSTKTEKPTAAQIEANLAQFNGSENLYQNFLRLRYTDGVQYLCEAAGAYWLVDAIASHVITSKKLRREPFLVVRLVVKDSKARLTFHSDFDQDNPKAFPSLKTQCIEYTDFPLTEIQFYYENRVLMLKSER